MFIPLLESFLPSATIFDLRSSQHLSMASMRAAVFGLLDSHFVSKIAPKETIVIGLSDPVAVLTALFAAWANGNLAVLVNPGLKPIEKANVIDHTCASHWFGDGAEALEASLSANRTKRINGSFHPAPLNVDDPALVLMTSGTTGTPKGIVHSVRTLKARLVLNNSFMPSDIMQNTLCVLPLFFGHGLIGNCLTPLAAGQNIHLWPSPNITEISQFGNILDEHQITFLSSVPTFWKLVLRLERPEHLSLKRVHIGSAPLSVANWAAVKDWTGCDAIFNMYGMTETANWIGGGDLQDAHGRDGFVGKIWGGRYAIKLENGEIKAQGRGEVVVNSPSTMLGYLNAEQQTKDAFSGEWFCTGDIGELSENGELTLVGRNKTEINRGGIKILAEEIDMMLERHPAIAEACAFGIPDDISGEAVAAAVVLKENVQISQAELRKWCLTQVRTEAVPGRIYIVDAIPKNDRGKIVRRDVLASLTGQQNDKSITKK
jgi:acyl-coenzyme A synthetase/AMP-(fatty) acid ligase